ncbi:MAG: VWA domain-containing protein [Acidobacteriota bacterium]
MARQTVWAAALGLALASGFVVAGAQPPQQNQQVPDAPRPQTLPNLNTLTPPSAPLPSAPAPLPQADAAATAAAKAANGGTVPSSKLPDAAQQAKDQQREAEQAGGVQGHASTIRVYSTYVQIPFTVKDSKGHLVPGLNWEDVQVFENGLRQQMRYFSRDPVPLSVALVIDQSVDFKTMDKINASLSALQGAFTPFDEIAVFTYNNGVKQQTTFTAAQSARLGAVLEKSKGKGREPNMAMGGPLDNTLIKNNEQVDPNTTPLRNQQGITVYAPKEFHTLNDAILAAAQETTHAGKERRKIVYVVSDGKEYGSKAREKDVVKYLQTNNVAVYATLVGDSGIPGMGFLDRIHLPFTMRDDALPRYAAATGGQCDPEFRPRGIEQSFAKITEEVRYQYTVGYYSHESPLDEKYRSVEVRVLRPSLDVIAKKGYYPTPTYTPPTPVIPTATP